MNVTPTTIADVLMLEPDVFLDERGAFIEVWQRGRFVDIGIDCEFVQDNFSRSVAGTLRGLHYQVVKPQGKLVHVTLGEIFDVAVDLRRSSATFGRWVGTYLSARNNRMLWIPPGFGHGFYVTAAQAHIQYKCSEYYLPEHERSILWNDPALAIQWPLEAPPLLSLKDRDATSFARGEYFP